MSGVRGGTKTPIRGDKSTVAARRAALQPQEPEVEHTEVDETEWIRDDAGGIKNKLSAMASGFLPGGGTKSRAVADTTRQGATTGRTKKSPEAGYGEDSAVHKLGQLRRGEAPPDEPVEAQVWTPEEDFPAGDPNSAEHDHQATDRPAPPADNPAGMWPQLGSDGTGNDSHPAPRPAWEDQPEPSRRADDRSEVTETGETPEETVTRWSDVAAPDLSQDPFASRR